MKKAISLILATGLFITSMVGCIGDDKFDEKKEINVISREDGSGTRGAFVELFGIEEKDADGKKYDNTREDAEITNDTSVMMTTVAGNKYSIGYISMGSFNDTVKGVKIDGAEPTTANAKSGEYKISRPFNIATKGDVSEIAQDFIDFILSDEGQKVVEGEKYIAVSDGTAYSGDKPKGKIVIAGSSSITPVMEKLKEAYLAINTNAKIEIQQSDSTTGMTSVIDGICDIGMASRELKDSELEKGIEGTVIAKDGIVVIINKENILEEISSEQIKSIFTGGINEWSEIIKEGID